ncbi:hypothetical protein BsWGS_08350 [Bradybaena similaris]
MGVFTTANTEVYGRYIDDRVGITQMSLDELNQFIHFFSNFHPHLILFPARLLFVILNSFDYTGCVLIILTSLTRPMNYLTSSMLVSTLTLFFRMLSGRFHPTLTQRLFPPNSTPPLKEPN